MLGYVLYHSLNILALLFTVKTLVHYNALHGLEYHYAISLLIDKRV